MLHLTLPDRTIAYQQCSASKVNETLPGIVFLGGFSSDMSGSKSMFLGTSCEAAGLAFLRFDYRGHGLSSGYFEDGCIGDWADDAVKTVEALTKGPQIFIGSSMGGWIGMLLAKRFPERFAGFIGIAAAPDFTEDLLGPSLNEAQWKEIEETGKTYATNAPEDFRIPFTKKLLDEGKNNLVLRKKNKLDVPIRLLQGMNDSQVPWQTTAKIAENVTSNDVKITLIKDGDHNLSRPQDLSLLWNTVMELL